MILKRDENNKFLKKDKFDFVSNGRIAQRKSWEVKHKKRWERMGSSPLPFKYEDK